jgi:hypothetical protein
VRFSLERLPADRLETHEFFNKLEDGDGVLDVGTFVGTLRRTLLSGNRRCPGSKCEYPNWQRGLEHIEVQAGIPEKIAPLRFGCVLVAGSNRAIPTTERSVTYVSGRSIFPIQLLAFLTFGGFMQIQKKHLATTGAPALHAICRLQTWVRAFIH